MSSFERPNFFSGKLLSAEDLSAEQQYQIGKRKSHNRHLHGWGVVSGLGVKTQGGNVLVSPGIAIDCEGNDLVVDQTVNVPAPSMKDTRNTVYVVVAYKEHKTNPVTTSLNGNLEWDRIAECYETFLANTNANAGHRHSSGRWIPCGQSHAITLARLQKQPNGWRVDRRYRPPKAR